MAAFAIKAEPAFQLYRQATGKIAGPTATAKAFLDRPSQQPPCNLRRCGT